MYIFTLINLIYHTYTVFKVFDLQYYDNKIDKKFRLIIYLPLRSNKFFY